MEFEDVANPDVHLANVLVLDYVAETRCETCEMLAKAGLNVLPAESLEVGLEALSDQEPDAVVISINTPGLDGRSLCEVIHRAHPARAFALFVITPSSDGDALEWATTIPDLIVIDAPVTAQKLEESLPKI